MVAFATAEDLATYLHSDVDTAAAEQGLEMASAKIRRATGQNFDYVGADEILLRGARPILTLPQRPVLAVQLIRTMAIGEALMTSRVADVDYTRSASDLYWTSTTARLNSPTHIPYLGWWPDYVEVTYSHGYAEIPDDVKECCIVRAAEYFTNPTFLAHERVDDYAYQTSRDHQGDRLLEALVKAYKGRVSMAALVR